MPYTIAAFVTRKPTMSPTDFQAAYESHVPFLRDTVGSAGSPETFARLYVRRAKDDPAGLKPISLTDSPAEFNHDVVAYLTFRDEEHAQVFQDAYRENNEAIGAKVAEFAELSQFQVIAFQDAIVE
jgi:hypothetical protein